MLCLQRYLLSALHDASPLPASYLHRRLLSTATASPALFVAEDYLVATCGLTPVQAHKASKYLSHLKSPSKPDAVRAFLADLGLSEAAGASAVVRYPRLLCSKVDKTLTHRVTQLRGIGLSLPEISRLVSISPKIFASPLQISRLAFYLALLGSYDKVHAALKNNPYLLGQNLENVVKPNLAFLRWCGLTHCDVSKVFVLAPRLLTGPQERLESMVARAEELGVPRGTTMFRHALVAAHSLRQENVTAKVELLKSLGFSSSQVANAVAKSPTILSSSEKRLVRTVNFLTKEAGLEVDAIARNPVVLTYSVEKRLVPRLNILKILKEEGLPGGNWSLCSMVCMTEEKFAKTFVHPHEESIPALADAYVAARAGEMRTGAAS